jgi:uncharacterized protein
VAFAIIDARQEAVEWFSSDIGSRVRTLDRLDYRPNLKRVMTHMITRLLKIVVWSTLLVGLVHAFGRPRPQDPQPPFPYVVENISIQSSAGVKLEGTLTFPRDEVVRAAVVLLSGSGPQDRDESVAGHRPFHILADHLTRQGIAVVRCDDRGAGASSGNFDDATNADFVEDAHACLHALKQRSELTGAPLGLIGHSAGSGIAARTALKNSQVAFVVLLGASGVPLDQGFVRQHRDVAQAQGRGDKQIENMTVALLEFCRIAKSDLDERDCILAVRMAVTKWYAALPAIDKDSQRSDEDAIDLYTRQNVALVRSPTFREEIRADPRTIYSALTCPVLILSGEKDLQANPEIHVRAIEDALTTGQNREVKAVILPKLNHLFQTANTGLPEEYETIEETFSPQALAEISSWILACSSRDVRARDADQR